MPGLLLPSCCKLITLHLGQSHIGCCPLVPNFGRHLWNSIYLHLCVPFPCSLCDYDYNIVSFEGSGWEWYYVSSMYFYFKAYIFIVHSLDSSKAKKFWVRTFECGKVNKNVTVIIKLNKIFIFTKNPKMECLEYTFRKFEVLV